MPKTERQANATAALELAIIECSAAFSEANPEATQGAIVTDWIVVTAESKPDLADPDEDITAYSVMMSGGGVPWYRAVGLLSAGRHFLGAPTEDS